MCRTSRVFPIFSLKKPSVILLICSSFSNFDSNTNNKIMETTAVLFSILIFSSISNWLSWIIFGLVAGWIADKMTKTKGPGGFIGTMLLGILGALLGGWLSAQILGYPITRNWSFAGFISAIVGAMILIWIWGKVGGKIKK